MHEPSTREAAIEAARELLLEEGLAHLSMRRVATAVGVSAPALYRHFDGKEALVWSVVEEGFRVFVGYLARALSADTPLERFRETGRAYFRFAREQPGYYTLIFGSTMKDYGHESAPPSAREQGDAAFQMLIDRIRDCIDAGCFVDEPPRSLAIFVWSQTHGLASLRMTGRLDELDECAFDAEAERTLERTIRALHR